jgi:hypothetical protein
MGNGNLLPTDYEEGTFAPILRDSTNTVSTYYYQHGRYTKIGNLVNVRIIISVNNKGSVSGDLYINNLPFTNMDTSAPLTNYFPITCFNSNTRDYDTARFRTSDKIELFYLLGSTGPAITGATIGSGSQIGLNFHYFTTE